MKGTLMSLRPPSNNYYWNKAKQIASFVFPEQSKLSGALKSSAQGAAIALSAVVITSALIAIVLLVSQKSSDLVSILLSGSTVALGSFGAVLLLDPSIASLVDLGSEVNVGVHSLTIALITLAFVYSISRRISKASRSMDSYELSPFHLALGFALMTFGISYVSRGTSSNAFGQIDIQGVTLLSNLFVFALVWAASYAGRIKGLGSNSDFEYVWRWATKAIKNFVYIYTTLILMAVAVLIIRTLIEPTYAIAQEPVAMNVEMTPDQTLWIFAAIVLYGANLLVQFFFLAMGVNVGLDLQGSQGVANLLSSIDANVVGNASQWSYNLVGPWGYLGVLVLVTVVALISGARAADQVGAKFFGVATYLKTLFIGLFVSLSILFLASMQLSVNFTPLEGETVSGGFVWGASLLGVIAFSTALLFVAHQSAGKSFDYMASAFPRTVLGKRNTGLNGPAVPGARLFGLFTIAAVLLVAATPIAASSFNRVSALVDGPAQVGQNASNTLTSATIADLKKFLNPKASTKNKWLPNNVLEAAQPSEGYSSRVVVTNGLGKPWVPGNLDATIVIELEKDGKVISKTFETTSTLTNNGLLNHVEYKPMISPTTVEVTLSKFLKNRKNLKIKLNGESVTPGNYFAIPGVYSVKSDGYKLVAPTDSTIYVENEAQVVGIGYKVKLPNGGGNKLNSGTKAKANSCMTVSKSGVGKCISKKEVVDKSSLASTDSVPEKYFDFRDYNFKSGAVTCKADKRKDSLVTAKVAKATTECEVEITFSRDYYKTEKRQVPNFVTTEVCVGGYESPYGARITGSEYDYWTDEYYYTDTSGLYWSLDSLEYDNCSTTQTKTVRDGNRTELVRGSKISTVKMTSSVTKKISVKGTLLDNGDFKVNP